MASYVSLENLQSYDAKLKTWVKDKDAEVLKKSKVSIVEAETVETGYAAAYEFYQDYVTEEGVEKKVLLDTVKIPSGQVIEAGRLDVKKDSDGVVESASMALVIANTTDADTTSGKKEITVDLTAIKDALNAIATLETQVGKDKTVNAYGEGDNAKTDLVDITNVLTGTKETTGSIKNVVYNEAANGLYGKLTINGEEKDATIKEAIENIGSVAATEAKVTIDSTGTPEEDALKTYVFYQGLTGTETDEEKAAKSIGKINIPKDFLVKSGSVVEFKDGDELPEGVTEAGKYLALVINVKSETPVEDETVYIKVTDLVDVYTAKKLETTDTDEVQIAIDDKNVISATLVDGKIAREKIDADFEADLAALEGTHATKTVDETEVYKTVDEEIVDRAKDGIYEAATGTEGEENYKPAKTIGQAIKALEDASSDTNGALVIKGEVANKASLPTDAKVGDVYKTTAENAAYALIANGETTEWVKIAIYGDFTIGDDEVASNNRVVTVKEYIDSRIFIGDADAIAAAKLAKEIDDSTFIIEVDENADSFTPITNDDIEGLDWD